MKINNFSDVKSLFFDNIGLKQTVIKNTFWLAVGEIGSRVLRLILFVYIARILGPTEYGKFTFALAFVILFLVFADFGLPKIVTREFSRAPEKEKEFSALLSLKILLSLGTFVLVLIGSTFITSDPLIQKVIWTLAICNLIANFIQIFYAFFHARQKMEYEFLVRIFGALVLAGAGFFILFYFPSIQNLSYSYLFASFVTLILVSLFFNFKIQRLSLNWNKSIWQRFLYMSWPLALTGAFITVCTQIDSIMMGYLGQITQTGWYNAASRIIWAILIPAGLISTSFFPVISKFFRESREKLQKAWNHQIKIMILLAIPLIIGGIVLAPEIINFIYDSSYFSSILAFQILMIMVGILFLIHPLQQILIVFDQQKKLFWAILSGAIINIILNLILIPRFSLYGAAISTVITNLLIFFLLIKFTLKFTTMTPFDLRLVLTFIGAVLCSIPMYFVISSPLIYSLNVVLIILIGAGVYSTCFFIINKIFKLNLI